jgi:hypothetical protein
LARHLPLHDEVGALEPRRRLVQESPQDCARHPERKVRDDTVRSGREGDVTRVGGQHDDVRRRREAFREAPHQLWIELHGDHVRGAIRERTGENAATGAELDNPISAADIGIGDELRREPGATEKMLTEVPATAPGASCAPGHGRSRP